VKPRNVKALFRQAKALYQMGKYDQAIQPLRLLTHMDVGNAVSITDKTKISEMLLVCETKLARYEKNEKEIYRRMFQPATTTSSSLNNNNKLKKNTEKKMENNTNNWWMYVTLGTAALAAAGIAAFIKYRKAP